MQCSSSSSNSGSSACGSAQQHRQQQRQQRREQQTSHCTQPSHMVWKHARTGTTRRADRGDRSLASLSQSWRPASGAGYHDRWLRTSRRQPQHPPRAGRRATRWRLPARRQQQRWRRRLEQRPRRRHRRGGLDGDTKWSQRALAAATWRRRRRPGCPRACRACLWDRHVARWLPRVCVGLLLHSKTLLRARYVLCCRVFRRTY